MLRELGRKIEKMEKLSQQDLLLEVHEAAEELQMKIDKNSFLLVNFASWEAGQVPKEYEDQENILQLKDNEIRTPVITSLSETVLELGPDPVSRSWNARTPNVSMGHQIPGWVSTESMFKTPVQWPSTLSFNVDSVITERESKTYESASSLSLATFTSLLIEFVARLQNLVDSFQELSEVAKFKDPVDLPVPAPAPKEVVGFWTRLRRFFFRLNSWDVSCDCLQEFLQSNDLAVFRAYQEHSDNQRDSQRTHLWWNWRIHDWSLTSKEISSKTKPSIVDGKEQ